MHQPKTKSIAGLPPSSWIRSFDLVCLSHGVQNITITTSNPVSQDLPLPVSLSTIIVFACKKPVSVVVSPVASAGAFVNDEHPKTRADGTPVRHLLYSPDVALDGQEVQVRRMDHVPVEAVFFHPLSCGEGLLAEIGMGLGCMTASGRAWLPFSNASSVSHQWSLDPQFTDDAPQHIIDARKSAATLLPLSQLSETQQQLVASETGIALRRFNPSLTILALQEKSIVDVLVSINSNAMDGTMLAFAKIHEHSLHAQFSVPLKHSVRLRLVDNVQLYPSRATIFNHPQNLLRLTCNFGSGVHRVELSDSRIANATSSVSGRHIDVRPLQVGVVVVAVKDTGLQGSRPAQSEVFVSDASRIFLTAPEQIPLGSLFDISIDVFDARQELFDVKQYTYMSIDVHTDNEIVSLKPPSSGSRNGTMLALALGTCRITVSLMNRDGSRINSNAVVVTIFPPLTVRPDFLLLLPHSYFRVQATGGPPSGVKYEFEIADRSIATVDEGGMVIAIGLGETELRVSAILRDGTISASDVILVRVALLAGAAISNKVTRTRMIHLYRKEKKKKSVEER